MDYKKIGDNIIEASETKTVVNTKTYNYDDLLEHRKNILLHKEADNALRDAELAEVDKLITEADKLGCKSKVAE